MKYSIKTMILGTACMMTMLTGCYAGNNFTSVRPSNNYVTKKVSLSEIDAIRSSSSVDVIYTQSSGKPYAEIYAPDNIVPLVKVEQDGNELKVGFKSNTSISGRFKCEVRVFAPEVTSFATSSSSDITLANGLKTSKDVNLNTSSSGDIDAESLQCGNLRMKSSSSGDISVKNISCGTLTMISQSSGDIVVTKAGCSMASIDGSSSGDCTIHDISCTGDVEASTSSSSDITLSGTCRNATFSASSAGGIYAKDLKANDITAKASSAGNIECNPSGVLSTSVSSAGDIRYAGNPTRVEGKIKGVSRL